MSNQEVFNMLSELESFFLYKCRNAQELEPFQRILNQMHEEAKTMLMQWHNITGCINE